MGSAMGLRVVYILKTSYVCEVPLLGSGVESGELFAEVFVRSVPILAVSARNMWA